MDPNTNDWQEPPIPEEVRRENLEPEMSEVATLGNIFIEPGRTFEDFRRKPRFVLAGLIIILAVSAFNVLFIQKIGYERIVRERIEASPQAAQIPSEQKDRIIEQQSGPIFKTLGYAAPPIVLIIVFLLGGLIYWLGANAMGGRSRFTQGLGVWVYSGFPPTVIFMLANVLVLFLKSADEIDVKTAQSGLVQANPNLFIDTASMPVVAALFNAFDLFAIWGWILAAIGLRIVGGISSGAAWGIVLLLALLGVTLRVVSALIFS
jgi:hypothetical protein